MKNVEEAIKHQNAPRYQPRRLTTWEDNNDQTLFPTYHFTNLNYLVYPQFKYSSHKPQVKSSKNELLIFNNVANYTVSMTRNSFPEHNCFLSRLLHSTIHNVFLEIVITSIKTHIHRTINKSEKKYFR